MRGGLDGNVACEVADMITGVGGVIGFMYNMVSKFRRKSHDVVDGEDTYVIGLGKYHGLETMEVLASALRKLLYFSYRYQFVPLKNGSTSDIGWGCTIRAGQMMLACAFMRYNNGGSASFGDTVLPSLREATQHLFRDDPAAPFGIHTISTEGARHGVPCGTWFGPTLVAVVFGALMEAYVNGGGRGPEVLVLRDRQVNEEEVSKRLRLSKHVLLLVPVMLGRCEISTEYGKVLKRCLRMESSVGAVGGKEASAFFFPGYQGDNLILLDPHYAQKAFTCPETQGNLSGDWYTIPLAECSTSMLLGFYVYSQSNFDQFKDDIAEACSSLMYPLIEVTAGGTVDRDFNEDNIDIYSFGTSDEERLACEPQLATEERQTTN